MISAPSGKKLSAAMATLDEREVGRMPSAKYQQDKMYRDAVSAHGHALDRLARVMRRVQKIAGACF